MEAFIKMTDEYVWLDEYNIGIEKIDIEHKQLFSIINKLFVMAKKGKDTEWVDRKSVV